MTKKYLVLRHVLSFGKKHILQIAFYTGTYLNKLLGTDAAHILAIYLHVTLGGRFHNDGRGFGLYLLGPGQDNIACQHRHQAYRYYQQPFTVRFPFSLARLPYTL